MMASSVPSTVRLFAVALSVAACGAATAPGDLEGYSTGGQPDAGRPSIGDSGASPSPSPGGHDSGGADAGGAPTDASSPAWPDATSTGDSHPVASCFQLDPQHTGAIEEPSLASPLTRIWDVDLGGLASYPLIARGLVYVTANAGAYAFERTTGARVWGPVPIGSGSMAVLPTYEGGRLYVLTWSGAVKSLDAATGNELWSIQLDSELGGFFDSPPTAYEGGVFVSGHDAIYAVDGLTGNIVWKQHVDGTSSAPVILGDAVYVSYACGLAQAFDRRTGVQKWEYVGSCSGGGAFTPAFFNGRLYVPDDSGGFNPDTLVLDPPTGKIVDHALQSSERPPGFHGSQAFFTSHDGSLYAEDLATHTRNWSVLRAGGTIVMTSPLVAGGRVFVGTINGVGKADVRALDEHTGAMRWSDDLSAYFYAGEDFGSSMALAVAEGVLVVPAMNHLIAYSAVTMPADH